MRLHYRINKRYLTTGTRQLCEPDVYKRQEQGGLHMYKTIIMPVDVFEMALSDKAVRHAEFLAQQDG